MQEIRYDGETKETSRVTREELERALADTRNQRVSVHREGDVVKSSNGRYYRVNALGQWCRVRNISEEAPRA